MKDIMSETVAKSYENIKKNENDYYENGLLYCGNCNTQKEFVLPSGTKVRCLCECMEKEMVDQEAKTKVEEHIRNNKRYIDSGFQNVFFKDVENLEQYYLFAKRYVETFETAKSNRIGLYIYGDTGNGKTFISSAIANELLYKGYRVLMIKNNEAIRKINESNGNTKENVNHFKNTIINMDLIIVDDFGANRETDYQLEQVYNFIDFLYSHKKLVIFTSNIPRQDLGNTEDIVKKRIYDRVIELSKPIYIEAKGRRKAIARDNKDYLDFLTGKDK